MQHSNSAINDAQTMRLNKFLAERLGVSRRRADELIERGEVFVERSGEERRPAVLGARIDKNDKVWCGGSMVPVKAGFSYTYVAMNKPVGYVCSRRQQGDAPTIFEILPKKWRALKTVGRLDKDSSGLILLTNDGDFAFSMTHPKFAKEKVYEVELNRPLQPLHRQMIADFGVELPDGRSQLGLERLESGDALGGEKTGEEMKDGTMRDRRWRVFMSEGRNRQIRRTFAALGYKVVALHRTQFGRFELDGLRPGEAVEIQKARRDKGGRR